MKEKKGNPGLFFPLLYSPPGARRRTPQGKILQGQRLDGTGLYYYNARYYDPTIGRFISADTVIPNPANPQCFNRYSYCLNNPLKYTDPSGHSEQDYWDLIHEAEKKQAEYQEYVADTGNLIQATGTAISITSWADWMATQTLEIKITNIIDTEANGGISNPKEDFTLTTAGFLLLCGVIVTDHVLSDLTKRGWTLNGINEAYTNPWYTSPSTNLRTKGPATAYYRAIVSGDYVVIDDVTMEKVQIGKYGDPYWKPNPAIRYPIPAHGNPAWGTGYNMPSGYYGPDMYGRWPW